ncbi:MAG: adenosylcobalamin-dependent ribonucleoside-diphosphate reductase [Methanomicrobiales archaeon]|nr:adenosylcobalamin-dependent ribonucleoside-diphosphate reductase [Methanomicrobiales archaeon]
MQLTENARILLENRYLLPGESPYEIFKRVANAVNPRQAEEYRKMMEDLLFLPNTPTLMNAGTQLGQLSACFVLPVEDSIENIFTTLKHMALIHKSGGGTGFSFSHLRPRGDMVQDTSGDASGPESFMRVYDFATGAVKQGGRRRGANMGILHCSHPDIFEFAVSKRADGLDNFNISVAFDDRFFECLDQKKPYELINPRDGEVWKEVDPQSLWNTVGEAAWVSGDPGVLFIDEINRYNTVPGLGPMEATNPCGEQPLYAYESCNLGSINLARCVRKHEIDMELLTTLVRSGVDFLDSIIEVNNFPFPEIRENTLRTRKIGLGVMGFAEALIFLDIPYESDEALSFADRIMAHIQKEARGRSHELGEEKGPFSAIDKSIFSENMRNATVTTVAPTGSLHIIADTSSGIEPLFSLAYTRKLNGKILQFVSDPVLEKLGKFGSKKEIVRQIEKEGSAQNLNIPDEIKNLLKTAPEISPEFHVRLQAAIQKHVENSVSKTINLPETATVQQIKSIYTLARDLKCKGITVYRYNSKKEQVLSRGCEICRVDS